MTCVNMLHVVCICRIRTEFRPAYALLPLTAPPQGPVEWGVLA